jgi:coenzyme F420-reducing hydrogenase delta subunit
LKTLLPQVGLDPGRVEMFNLSAAEGPKWAQFCTDFTERIRHLGPSPQRVALCRPAKKE